MGQSICCVNGRIMAGTPNSDEHFSSSARQILPKFSVSLAKKGPPSRGEKIPKSDEGVLRKSGPKYTPVENFNPPYIPQMGGDPPRTKFVFARVPRPTMCYGQLRGGNPLGE